MSEPLIPTPHEGPHAAPHRHFARDFHTMTNRL